MSLREKLERAEAYLLCRCLRDECGPDSPTHRMLAAVQVLLMGVAARVMGDGPCR